MVGRRGRHGDHRGIVASSVALTGFGLDPVIEFAAAVVVWELRGQAAGMQTRSMRLIGITPIRTALVARACRMAPWRRSECQSARADRPR